MKSAKQKDQWEGVKIVAQNRAASYNYTLLDKLEAGLILVGTEVKSLREGKGTLRDAYAEIRAGEGWLVNCHIPEYLPGGVRNHDPLRKRKLLLNRRELDKLVIQTQQKGLTIVPTEDLLPGRNREVRAGGGQRQEVPRPARSRTPKRSQTRSRRSHVSLAAAMNRKRKGDMQIQLETQPYSSLETDALVTYVFDRDDKFDGVLADINVGMSGRLSALAASGELTGKSLELGPDPFSARDLRRSGLLLVGAGKPGKFGMNDLRKIAGTALRYLEIAGREEDCLSGARRRARARKRRKPWSKGLSPPISNRTNTAPKRRTAKFSPWRSSDSMPAWATAFNRRRPRPRRRRVAEFRARPDQRAFE